MPRTKNISSGESRPSTKRPIWPLVVAWLLTILIGFGTLTKYEFTPAESAAASSSSRTDVARRTPAEPSVAKGWTLTVALHPKCICSPATLTQIEWIVAAHPELDVQFLVFHSESHSAEWHNTKLVQRARKLGGQLLEDWDGQLAHEEGLPVSGATYLTDPAGKVRFRGGLTNGRGHEGLSIGTKSIETLLIGGETEVTVTPAYGCEVQD